MVFMYILLHPSITVVVLFQRHVSDPTNRNRSRRFFKNFFEDFIHEYTVFTLFWPIPFPPPAALWPLSVYRFLIFYYCCIHGCICDTMYVWKSKDSCMESVLSTSVWVSTVELKYSGYIASTFICWAALLADEGDLVALGACFLSRTFVQATAATGTPRRQACECGRMIAPVLCSSLV